MAEVVLPTPDEIIERLNESTDPKACIKGVDRLPVYANVNAHVFGTETFRHLARLGSDIPPQMTLLFFQDTLSHQLVTAVKHGLSDWRKPDECIDELSPIVHYQVAQRITAGYTEHDVLICRDILVGFGYEALRNGSFPEGIKAIEVGRIDGILSDTIALGILADAGKGERRYFLEGIVYQIYEGTQSRQR